MSTITIISIEHIRKTYVIEIEDTDNILPIKSAIEKDNTFHMYVEEKEIISEDVVSITVD